MLKELLDDVVPKHIDHQTKRMVVDLLEDHLALLGCRLFQLLLDEAGAVLVPAELDHVAFDVL